MNNFHTRNKTRAPPPQAGLPVPRECFQGAGHNLQSVSPTHYQQLSGLYQHAQAVYPTPPPIPTPFPFAHPMRYPIQVRWLPPSFSIKLTAPPPASTGDPGLSTTQRRFPPCSTKPIPTVDFLVAAQCCPRKITISTYLLPTSSKLTSFFLPHKTYLYIPH
jgi:hypothetical protein